MCEKNCFSLISALLIGEWDFCDLELLQKPPVFIPRPETEELVELILQQCDDKLTMRFLEVCIKTNRMIDNRIFFNVLNLLFPGGLWFWRNFVGITS